jgi:hypothetical protein
VSAASAVAAAMVRRAISNFSEFIVVW